ncbi:hypothetical protein SDC9_151145 [bioreactor metagenome]|uniref:Uncharacterized protein n=1 Tax=bioreactor metagenome TaxID=1076179 RepID=A0A645ERC4_9ZZZZ
MNDIVERKARHIRHGIGKRGGEQNTDRRKNDVVTITMHQLADELPVCLLALWFFDWYFLFILLHNISCGFTSTIG